MTILDTMIRLAQSSIGFDPKKNVGADPAEHPTVIESIVPVIKAHGYEGVEIWAPHLDEHDDARLDALREQLDELELAVPLISGYFNFTKNADKAAESMAAARRIIGQARRLGAAAIRVFTGGDRSADASPEQWERCICCLQELCDSCADDDIDLCLHTHDWNLVDSIAGCRRTLDMVDRPNCSLLYKPAYFLPDDHWTLEALGPATSTVQVTVAGTDSGDLAQGTIDYRAHMAWFARRRQPVWFCFTWMKDDARGHGQRAFTYLDRCRQDVEERLRQEAQAGRRQSES